MDRLLEKAQTGYIKAKETKNQPWICIPLYMIVVSWNHLGVINQLRKPT